MDQLKEASFYRRGIHLLSERWEKVIEWVEIRPLRRAMIATILQLITKAIILRYCSEEILSEQYHNDTQLKSVKLTRALYTSGSGIVLHQSMCHSAIR